MNTRLLMTLLIVCAAAGPAVGAPAPSTSFTYQGRLTDHTNSASGTYELQFTLYDSASGGSPLAGPLLTPPLAVNNGLFTVALDFGQSVFSGPPRWLGIEVRTNGGSGFSLLLPRQALTPVPYAIAAANLNGNLPATQLTGILPPAALAGAYPSAVRLTSPDNQYAGDGTGLRFGGFDYCALPCYWNLRGNAGTTPGLNFVGTLDRQPLELRVQARRALRLEPTGISPNLIGGFEDNSVSDFAEGSTIGGGGAPGGPNYITATFPSGFTNDAQFGTVAGGLGNFISASSYSTISGGSHNSITENFFIAGGLNFNTIGGGTGNLLALSMACTIAGGMTNSMIGDGGDRIYYSTIGGGIGNSITTFEDGVGASVIAGGDNNRILRSSRVAIGGGQGNSISVDSDHSAIGGGSANSIGAVAQGAAIAGGLNNVVDTGARGAAIGGGDGNHVTSSEFRSSYGTISGGQHNLVTGTNGTIAGGVNNEATNNAFAAGNRAKAVHAGAFVWAAGNTADYPSRADNSVQFYAPGGLRAAYGGQAADGQGLKWVTLASPTPNHVVDAFNGAYLSDGGVWTDSSDRNAKENFEPVQPREILERVAALPLNKWNYRSEDESIRHLGPVAQDFYQAFGLGADDKHIAGLDTGGVALAAIQGLNQKLEEKQAEVVELKARLEALEKLLRARPAQDAAAKE